MANNDKNFYNKGFDQVTDVKLQIYQEYLQLWLPVPMKANMGVTKAVVYDLFCGPGKDSNGKPGSPLIAKEVVYKNSDTISTGLVPLKLIFNDRQTDHIEALKNSLGADIHTQKGVTLASIEYYNEDFDSLFPQLFSDMEGQANFLFIDQFGVTGIDKDRFLELRTLTRTDVLFYIHSDWFRRFAERPEAEDWDISKADIMEVPYSHIHREMADYFCSLVGDSYYVAPFSLKRGSNIHGLIFATGHLLGLEKFLKVAWKTDPFTGEANFDIDEEGIRDPGQQGLFEARKLSGFQQDLESRILREEFPTDGAIYQHVLESGFLTAHSRPIVMSLRKAGKVDFQDEQGVSQQPRISMTGVKEPRQLVLRP